VLKLLNTLLINVLTLSLTCLLAISNVALAEPTKPIIKTDANSFPITDTWSVEKLLALNHDEVLALWETLDPPVLTELDGHYMGLVPNGGDAEAQAGLKVFMYNENSSRGYWLGKAYKATSATAGEGYNRWRFPGGKVVRNLRFGTKMGTSLIDGRPALMMYYGDFNDSTLTDEIRKLDEYIFLGMGTTLLENGERSAPGHFILTGPTDDWVGVDNES